MSEKEKAIAIVLVMALITLILAGCTISSRKIHVADSTVYNKAYIIQPDNTLVYGKLEYYDAFANNTVFSIKMSNGKTYLVPFTRMTLVADGN